MLVDIVIDVTQKKIDCRIHWSVMIKLETYFIKIFCSFYILYNTWYHIFVILLIWASVEMWVCSYCQAVTSWIWWRSEVFLQGDDHLLPGVVCLWTSWTWAGLSDWFFAVASACCDESSCLWLVISAAAIFDLRHLYQLTSTEIKHYYHKLNFAINYKHWGIHSSQNIKNRPNGKTRENWTNCLELILFSFPKKHLCILYLLIYCFGNFSET